MATRQSTEGNTPANAAYYCLVVAHDALKMYLEYDRYLFQNQATLRSVLKNIIGVGKDLRELRDQANVVELFCQGAKSVCHDRYERFGGELTPLDKQFFLALLPYVDALERATSILARRQQALFLKREGVPLSMSEYEKMNADYNAAMDEYKALGGKLQPLAQRVLANGPR